jgi:hypothetical protein
MIAKMAVGCSRRTNSLPIPIAPPHTRKMKQITPGTEGEAMTSVSSASSAARRVITKTSRLSSTHFPSP